MAQRVRDILLRIRGDASDAENDLHQLAREVKEFGTLDAEATVDVNTKPAKQSIQEAQRAIKDYGRLSEEAKIDLQTKAADIKLKQLRDNLDNLQKRPASVKIDLAIGSTIAKIERVEAQLDRLDRRRVDVNVDVDRHSAVGAAGGIGRAIGAGVSTLASGLSSAAQGIGLVVGAASRGIPIIGGFGQLLVQLGISGAALGPILLLLIPVIIALAGAVTLLVGAFVALAASLLTAAAGVGVLAFTLAAAFGPVVLVAIAAMARFAKILEAVKASEDNAANSAQRHKDALAAQKTQAEAVSDAIRGIADAELARDQAHLNVKQAEKALADFRKEAGLTKTSLDDLFTKFTDIDFRPENLIKTISQSQLGQQEGVDPNQLSQLILNVRQARQGEANAIDGVSDAHERLAEARQTEAKALEEQDDKLKGLTKRERDLVDVIVDVKKALTDAFRPATQRIFAGIIDFLKDLVDFAKDTRVRSGLTAIGEAIGGIFRTMGRELRRRETRDTFAALANGAARLVRILGNDVFRSVFRILLRIAREALPWLIDVAEAIGGALRRLERTSTRSRIADFVHTIRRSFERWKRVVIDLWEIIKEFFGSARDSGDKLADKIHKILTDFKDWLKQNPDAIKEFFEKAADFASSVADSLESIAKSLADIVAMKDDILDIFGAIAAGATGDTGKAPKPKRTIFGIPFASGGLVPGSGVGDIVPARLTPGEFVVRRSIAQAIGVPRLNMINAGKLATASGGGINIENINLPPAPGHDQLGDPRHQAVQLARELRRRGGIGLTGGGIG